MNSGNRTLVLRLLAGCSTSKRQGNEVSNRTDTYTHSYWDGGS